jgi:hypothetical protein
MAGSPSVAFQTKDRNNADVTIQSLPVGIQSAAGSVSITPASDATFPLPSGAAKDSTLASILAAIKATVNLSGSVWYDPTITPVVFYVRRESVNEGTGVITVVWETPSGSAAAPAVANLVAVANSNNIANSTLVFTATAAGTGYAIGDVLIHAFGIDTATTPATLAYSMWLNAGPSVSTGAIIAAPTSGNYTQSVQQVAGAVNATVVSAPSITISSSALPTGASTAAKQDSLLTALGSPLQAGGTVLVSGVATAAKQDSLLTALGSPLQAGGAVSVSSSALPTGASTAAKQDSLLTALGSPLQAGGAVSVSTSVLPTGAATAANQNVTAAGTSATNAQAIQGVTGGIAIPISEVCSNWIVNASGVSGAPIQVVQAIAILCAARPGRKEVILVFETAIQARIGYSNSGGSALTATAYGALYGGEAQESLTISTSGAVYAFAPSGTASISVIEVW